MIILNLTVRKYKDTNLNTYTTNGMKDLKDNYFLTSDYKFIEMPIELTMTDLLRKLALAIFPVSDFIKDDIYYKKLNVDIYDNIQIFNIELEEGNIYLKTIYNDLDFKENNFLLFENIEPTLSIKYFLTIKTSLDLLSKLLDKEQRLVNIKKDID